jgi:predicted glycosyltransferase
LALSKSLEWSIDNLFAIGLSRFDSRVGDSDIRAAKSELGFNPDAPLCVFCSVSEIGGFELIHSTFHVLERILELKRKKPDLQIVYRVHHGINYDILREYFQALNIPGLFFEESLQPPHPLFLDLVKAADFVVAQAGSAISESLVTGVPVIYLCALSIVDPAYLDCEAILVADSFDKLDSSIQQLLDSPLSRQEVRRLAQPFLDKIICGADGATNKRLADLIFQLLDDQDRCNLTGWGDWLKRFEKSFITDAKLD